MPARYLPMRLIADVGGTNSRVALSCGGQILPATMQRFINDDWQSFYEIVTNYLSTQSSPELTEVVVAVAGPVNEDYARLTNRTWEIEKNRLAGICGQVTVKLLNDLTALGHSAPDLRPDQLRALSPGAAKQAAFSQSLVVGIGTGFNVSLVLKSAGSTICPAVEAGHISMPSGIVEGLCAMGFANKKFHTIEKLFSGRGFGEFCQHLTGRLTLDGPEAIAGYSMPETPELKQAVDHYSSLLGTLLRDLSLAYMPLSGIYLAGSVSRSIMAVSPTPCVEAFRRPAHIPASNSAPVWLIQDDAAALAGCAQLALR